MKLFNKHLSMLLILALALSALSACGKKGVSEITETIPAESKEGISAQSEAPAGYYQVGDKIDDFTVITYDGREVSLYKVLEEKEMVLLNLWATWCGPCGMEFPAMQQAYEQYQDRVEIIAVSLEPTDSDEVLAAYVQEKGMTFSVGRDTAGLGSRIRHSGIPTSVVVDRFGTICLIEEGAMPDSAIFTNLFAIYTAEDYSQSIFLPSMRYQKPNVQPADPEQLNEALNADGGTVEFTNISNGFYWPMTVEEKDGRRVVAASNVLSLHSKSVVRSQVDVNAGDVLVMEYKLKSESYTNFMSVDVDGKSVKKSSLTRDWGTFAYRFEEGGSREVSVWFEVGALDAADDDGFWIDSIRIVSGEEATKALEANPKYPVGEKTQIKLLNEAVKNAYIYNEADPSVTAPIYFCADPTLQLMITLDETLDPENTCLENANTYEIISLASCAVEDGFLVELASAGSEQYLTGASLYSDGILIDSISVYYSEEKADGYFDLIRQYYGESIRWEYSDEFAGAAEVGGDVTYTVTYVDQNGDPVPGVVCQVCDESMCQVFTSDANGVCRFTLPVKSYEIHTLIVPEGYEGDTTTITKVPAQGGDLAFALTKK